MPDLTDTFLLLRRDGAASFPASILRTRVCESEGAALRAAWEDLPRDDHLPGGDDYRFRRYGRMRASPVPDGGYELVTLPPADFQQHEDLIPLYRGAARRVAPVEEATAAEPALRALIQFDLDIIAQAEGARRTLEIGLHLIRVVADLGGRRRAPAPEGRHRDGHDWIAMHLMGRRACSGGASRVYPGDAPEPLLVTTLQEPLDTLVIDDRRVEHEVTSIVALDKGAGRDMLLVDFDGPDGPDGPDDG